MNMPSRFRFGVRSADSSPALMPAPFAGYLVDTGARMDDFGSRWVVLRIVNTEQFYARKDGPRGQALIRRVFPVH